MRTRPSAFRTVTLANVVAYLKPITTNLVQGVMIFAKNKDEHFPGYITSRRTIMLNKFENTQVLTVSNAYMNYKCQRKSNMKLPKNS